MSEIPSLNQVAEGTLSRLSKQTILVSLTVIALAAISIFFFIIRPSYKEFSDLKMETEKALSARNKELVRAAVEQGAANMVRVLGAAETTVQNLVTVLESSPVKTKDTTILPLETEFFPNGSLVGTLSKREGYESPVTLGFPQIKPGDPAELGLLGNYWQAFHKAAKTLHAGHPELKWLYLGTQGGSFMVFPTSPMIPSDFDPRTRPWYIQSLKEKKMQWVSPYFTAGGNDLVLTVAQPLSSVSPFKNGVVAVDVVMADIINQMLSTPYCDKCTLYVVNDRGEIMGKRGDKAQGASWENIPEVRTLQAEFQTMFVGSTASQLVGSALAKNADTLAEQSGLSRSPRSRPIDSPDIDHAIFSAPIENLGWSLVGIVPKKYPGVDGVKVLDGIEGLLHSIRTHIGVFLFGVALFIALLLIGVFRVARSSVQRNLRPTINQFSDLATELENLKIDEPSKGVPLNASCELSTTVEHKQLVIAIDKMRNRLVQEAESGQRLAVQAKLGELAAQVAHDIRSPLSSMMSATEQLSRGSGDIREGSPQNVLKLGINRVNSIVSKLLRKYQEVSRGSNDSGAITPKLTLVDKVLHDVLLEFKTSLPPNIVMEEEGFSEVPRFWAYIQVSEIQAAVANILRNAIEAVGTAKNGKIRVSLKSESGKILLEISDNGCGIDKEILPNVFDKNYTHGKLGGTGLGLFQAKTAVEWHEGRLSAESKVGVGSTFRIELKTEPAPAWVTTQVRLDKKDKVFFVDDDPSMLEFWRNEASKHPAVEPQFLSSLKGLPADLDGSVLVLDEHFRDENETGLSKLESIKGFKEAYLCTTAFDEPRVQTAAKNIGLKVIPKPLLNSVSVQMNFGK